MTYTERQATIGTVTMGTPYKTNAGTSRMSIMNAQAVLHAVGERFPAFLPEAVPYVNILSYNEWMKRGYQVRKGEKAIRCAGEALIIRKDEEGKDEFLGTRSVTACVFALPQVEPITKA